MVVAGVHPRRPVVGVPQLPHGRGGLVGVIDHEPPARVVRLADYLQCEVAPVHQGEDGEEELCADDPRGDVGAVGTRQLVEEVVDDRSQGCGGNDAQEEREDVGDLEARGVALAVEEGPVEGGALGVKDGRQGSCVVAASQRPGQLLRLAHVQEEAERRGEAHAHFGLGRRRYPVAVVTVEVADAAGGYGGEHELDVGHDVRVEGLGRG